MAPREAGVDNLRGCARDPLLFGASSGAGYPQDVASGDQEARPRKLAESVPIACHTDEVDDVGTACLDPKFGTKRTPFRSIWLCH